MWPFNRKSTISCQELAEILVPKFARSTIKLFEGVKLSWINQSDKENNRTKSLKEWVMLNLAGYINGCRSSMKQDEIHFEFVRTFVAVCGSHLVELGVFPSEAEFEQLAKDHMSDYLNAFKGHDVEKEMQIVGRKFLVNVGCQPDDISNRIAAVGAFMNNSTASKKLFDEIEKSDRIVTSMRGK